MKEVAPARPFNQRESCAVITLTSDLKNWQRPLNLALAEAW